MNAPDLPLAGRAWPALLRGPDWARWLVLFVFLAVGLGLRSPWPADEPRFALIAMDMVQNSHWLLPHRGGEIYADKPPVFMWLQAAFFLLTGNMRIAFLLPSLLAAMLTLRLVYDLTLRLFDREAAWFAVLVLVATPQFTLQAKSAQIDMALCAWTTLALYGLVRHFCIDRSLAWYAIAWFAMGMGIVTKGVGFLPVFALPGLLVAGRPELPARKPARWQLAAAPLLLLLPAILWLLPLVIRAWVFGDEAVGAYLDEILYRQTVTRYAAGLGHFKPFWYYATSVIPALWTPLLVLGIWLAPDWLRRLRSGNAVYWMLLGYAVLALAFFSASPGKRGVYMLPLLPALAIVAGAGIDSLRRARGAVFLLRCIAFVAGAVLILAAGATSFNIGPLTETLDRSDLDVLPTMTFLMSLGATWVLSAILVRRGGAFTVATALSWLLLSTWGSLLFDPVRSSDKLMNEVAARLEPEDELAIVGFREQQLLQADRDVVHWRYHDDVNMQIADALEWLRGGSGRHVLVANSTARPCLGDKAGQWLGFRHRRDWQLVSASDVPPAIRCTPDGRPVRRFLARRAGYPTGVD